MTRYILMAFLAPLAFGQPAEPTVDRTFHLTSNPSPQGLQEIATVLRTVADVRRLTIDQASPSMLITETPGNIARSEWLVTQLDKPAGEPRDNAVHEYRTSGADDDVIRVFYLNNIRAPQSFQELLTVLRTVGQIRKIFMYTAPAAIAVRGTSAEIGASAWLIQELDQPVTTPGAHQYREPGNTEDVTRVYYLENDTNPPRVQSVLSALRGNAQIRRVFNFSARGAVIVRGTPAEIAHAGNIVAQLDQPIAR